MLKDTINRLDAGNEEISCDRHSEGMEPRDGVDVAVDRLRHQQREAARLFVSLTKRERQVIQLVTSGLPNKTVAHQLQLSVKTVEKYRGRLMKKLRLRNMCELFRFWFVLTWDGLFQSECLGR